MRFCWKLFTGREWCLPNRPRSLLLWLRAQLSPSWKAHLRQKSKHSG